MPCYGYRKWNSYMCHTASNTQPASPMPAPTPALPSGGTYDLASARFTTGLPTETLLSARVTSHQLPLSTTPLTLPSPERFGLGGSPPPLVDAGLQVAGTKQELKRNFPCTVWLCKGDPRVSSSSCPTLHIGVPAGLYTPAFVPENMIQIVVKVQPRLGLCLPDIPSSKPFLVPSTRDPYLCHTSSSSTSQPVRPPHTRPRTHSETSLLPIPRQPNLPQKSSLVYGTAGPESQIRDKEGGQNSGKSHPLS